MYAATGKEGEVAVNYDPSGVPFYIFGNASALGQVFRNLIDNAKSFSPPDGTVYVAVVDKDEEQFSIVVEDEGPGIPEDALEKIFTRFYTKRPKGAAFGNNSGLGLAISRQIVNSHGGSVIAENRAEGGARFIVHLAKP